MKKLMVLVLVLLLVGCNSVITAPTPRGPAPTGAESLATVRGSNSTPSGGPPTGVAPGGRPNIVVVMLDDVAQVPAQSLFARMPKVNSMFLQAGQEWTHFSGNDPLCCPARAGFLTGLYSHHHGVITNQSAAVFRPEETIATKLHSAGYWTALVGKYLNGTGGLADKRPPGWDQLAIGSGGYWDVPLWVNGTREDHIGEYSTEVIGAKAVSYLRAVPPTQPVFLELAFTATHADNPRSRYPAVEPKHAGDAACAGIGVYQSPAYGEVDRSDKPAYIRDLSATRLPPAGWPLQKACESLLSVDDAFAAVSDELAAENRWSNTLFVLVGDNGMAWGDHNWLEKKPPFTAPVPMYLRWDARLGSTASTITAYAQLTDLAPTFADLAGAGAMGPYPTGQASPDGQSIASTILTGALPARDALLEEHRDPSDPDHVPAYWAIRTTNQSNLGLWHYVEYSTGECELYNLDADPFEMVNRCDDPALAATRQQLASQLAALRST